MGKTRVIAETGAGQHGVATATAAALMGLECEIYMGKEEMIRQALNVYKMRLLGAKVYAVESGTATLKKMLFQRHSANGSAELTIRIMCWALLWGRIRFQRLSEIFRQ